MPPRVLALRRSAMAEGRGDGELNAGIAHLQSLHAMRKQSANHVDAAPSALDIARHGRALKWMESLLLWWCVRLGVTLQDFSALKDAPEQ